MVEELNAALAQVKESGVYDELLVKWFVEYEGEGKVGMGDGGRKLTVPPPPYWQ